MRRTKTKRKKWAFAGGNRLTDENGRASRKVTPFTDDEDAARERLIPGVIRGDVDAIIEYLTRFGGKEWQQ